jgi:hypothetical protein
MKNMIIYLLLFLIGLGTPFLFKSCFSPTKKVETTQQVQPKDIHLIEENMEAEISYLNSEDLLSKKEEKELRKQLDKLNKENNIVLKQKSQLEGELDKLKTRPIQVTTITKTDTIKEVILTTITQIEERINNTVLNNTAEECCGSLKSLNASTYTISDTFYREGVRTIINTTTKGYPIVAQDVNTIFDKFIVQDIKSNSIFLSSGFTIPDFSNSVTYVPLTLTYNKNKWSYTFTAFTNDFTKVSGGEFKVGLRLFRW